MTTKIISISPDTTLKDAVNILLEHSFNGLPVLDKDGFLVGILTEFDVIIAGASIHMPAFKRMKDDEGLSDDKSLQEDLGRILNMKVTEVMNTEPFVLKEDDLIEDVMKAFGEHHRVNPIPIVDDNKRMVGIVSRFDVVKFLRDSMSDWAKKISQT